MTQQQTQPATRSRSRRRRAQIGTDHYLLRCPRCRAFQELDAPAYREGPPTWEDLPWLTCGPCGRMSATTAWTVVVARFDPIRP